jgi:hypothetical protein
VQTHQAAESNSLLAQSRMQPAEADNGYTYRRKLRIRQGAESDAHTVARHEKAQLAYRLVLPAVKRADSAAKAKQKEGQDPGCCPPILPKAVVTRNGS